MALLRNGARLHVTPKEYELLLYLVRNAGRLLPRAEIIDHLWPGTFVEEGNLTQLISLLRKVLEEDPDAVGCIRTLPRQGYIFTLPVKTLTRRGPRRRRTVALLAIAIILVAIGISARWIPRMGPQPGEVVLVVPVHAGVQIAEAEAMRQRISRELVDTLASVERVSVVQGRQEATLGAAGVSKLAAEHHAAWVLTASVEMRSALMMVRIAKWKPKTGNPIWVHEFECRHESVDALVERLRADVREAFAGPAGP